eukprot:gene3296-3616_t
MKALGSSQVKFAELLAGFKQSSSAPSKSVSNKKVLKDKSKARHPQYDQQTHDELPISQEMIAILQQTANAVDDNGYLDDHVSSLLSQPLNSASVFFPTASVLASTLATVKGPNPEALGDTDLFKEMRNQGTMGFLPDTSIISIPGSESDSITRPAETTRVGTENNQLQDFKSRLQVLWLKRRSQLERKEGHLADAANSMAAAVLEHLGSSDYSQARLLEPTMTSDPIEILTTVKESFFLYDQLAHIKADKIQRCYRKHHQWRSRCAERIAALYRGHSLRKKLREERAIAKQCARLIQRRFRKHLKRMHALATKIKQWYKLWKDVKAYWKRLFIYKMARKIQKVIRGFLGRRLAGRIRRRVCAARLIQRNVRGYLVRSERLYQLTRLHRIFFLAARKIQRFVRYYQAVVRARMKVLLELLAEEMRHKKEVICLQQLLRMEKVKAKLYMKTLPGILQVYFERRKLLAKRLLMIEGLQKAISASNGNSTKSSTKKKKKRSSESRKERSGDEEGTEQATGMESIMSSYALPSAYAAVSQEYALQDGEITFVTPDVIDIMDKYDEFDDSRILTTLLPQVLADLNVNLPSSLAIEALVRRLDPEESGYFEIPAFLKWFESEEADEFIEVDPSGESPMTNKLDKFACLTRGIGMQNRRSKKSQKANLLAKDIEGYLAGNARYRNDRLLHREIVMKHKRKEFIALFRMQHRPKYQCCQCLEAFALFTDYYQHFVRETVVVPDIMDAKETAPLADSKAPGEEEVQQVGMENEEEEEGENENEEAENDEQPEIAQSAEEMEKEQSDMPLATPKTTTQLIGRCMVTQQYALYYPTYWLKEHWQKQRMLEEEIVRVNDEFSYVSYQKRKSLIEVLSHFYNKDQTIHRMLARDMELATKRFFLPLLREAINPPIAKDVQSEQQGVSRGSVKAGASQKSSKESKKKSSSSKKGKRRPGSGKKRKDNRPSSASSKRKSSSKKTSTKLSSTDKLKALREVMISQIVDVIRSAGTVMIPDVILDLLATSWRLNLPVPWLIEEGVEIDQVAQFLDEQYSLYGQLKSENHSSASKKRPKSGSRKKANNSSGSTSSRPKSGKKEKESSSSKKKSTSASSKSKASKRGSDKERKSSSKKSVGSKKKSKSAESAADIPAEEPPQDLTNGIEFSDGELQAWSGQAKMQIDSHPISEHNNTSWFHIIRRRFAIPALRWSSLCEQLAQRLSWFALKVLELYRTEAEAACMALIRFRGQRPRKLSLSDEDCTRLNLQGLSYETFLRTFVQHTDRLVLLSEKHRGLLVCKTRETALYKESGGEGGVAEDTTSFQRDLEDENVQYRPEQQEQHMDEANIEEEDVPFANDFVDDLALAVLENERKLLLLHPSSNGNQRDDDGGHELPALDEDVTKTLQAVDEEEEREDGRVQSELQVQNENNTENLKETPYKQSNDGALLKEDKVVEEIGHDGVEIPIALPKRSPYSVLIRFLCCIGNKGYHLIPSVPAELLIWLDQQRQLHHEMLREHAYARAHVRVLQQSPLGDRLLNRLDQKMKLILSNKRLINILNLPMEMQEVDDDLVLLLHKVFVKLAVLQDQSHIDLLDIDLVLQDFQSNRALARATTSWLKATMKNNESLTEPALDPTAEEVIYNTFNPLDKQRDGYALFDIIKKQFDPHDRGIMTFQMLQQGVNQLFLSESVNQSSRGCLAGGLVCFKRTDRMPVLAEKDSITTLMVRCRRIYRLKYFILSYLSSTFADDVNMAKMSSFWKSLMQMNLLIDSQDTDLNISDMLPVGISAKFHQRYQLDSRDLAVKRTNQPRNVSTASGSDDPGEDISRLIQLHYLFERMEEEREQREIVEVLQEEAEKAVNQQLSSNGWQSLLRGQRSRLKDEQLLVECLEEFLTAYLHSVRIHFPFHRQSGSDQVDDSKSHSGPLFRSSNKKYIFVDHSHGHSMDSYQRMNSRDDENNDDNERELHTSMVLTSVVEIFVRFFDCSCLGILDQWEVGHLFQTLHTVVLDYEEEEERFEDLPLSALLLSQHLAEQHARQVDGQASSRVSGRYLGGSAMDRTIVYSCDEVVRFLCANRRIAWGYHSHGNPLQASRSGNQDYGGSSSSSRLAGDDYEVSFPLFSQTLCARTGLLGVHRRRVRKHIEQTLSLTQAGRIIMNLSDQDPGYSIPPPQKEISSQQSLLIRCQLLAMRQVRVFLEDTTLGKLQQYLLIHTEIHPLYRYCIESDHPSFAGEDYPTRIFRYAYALHSEGEYILITELPHVISYLVQSEGFVKTNRTGEVAKMIFGCLLKRYLRWIPWEEAHDLLSDYLCYNYREEPKAKTTSSTVCSEEEELGLMNKNIRRYLRDSEVRMTSRARQQAVLIAMDFEDAVVAETNYRCQVLGLYDVAAQMIARESLAVERKEATEVIHEEQEQPRRSAGEGEDEGEEEVSLLAESSLHDSDGVGSTANPNTIRPVEEMFTFQETVGLFLLSRGYIYSDFMRITKPPEVPSSSQSAEEQEDESWPGHIEHLVHLSDHSLAISSSSYPGTSTKSRPAPAASMRAVSGPDWELLSELYSPERGHGNLDYTEVSLSLLLSVEKEAIWKRLSWRQGLHRSWRYLTQSRAVEKERMRLNQAMRHHAEDIDLKGGDYLKEIITGISQSAQELNS